MKSALFIGLFVVVFGLVIGLYIRRREIAFEGKVVDKDIREQVNNNFGNNSSQGQGLSINLGNASNLSNVTHQYMIKVQTDAGKTINWQVSQGKYEIINIGDRVSKPAGTTEVDVTSQTKSPPPASNTPAEPPVSIAN